MDPDPPSTFPSEPSQEDGAALSLSASDVYRRMPYHDDPPPMSQEAERPFPLRLGTIEESGISYYDDEDGDENEDMTEMTQRVDDGASVEDAPAVDASFATDTTHISTEGTQGGNDEPVSDTETVVWSETEDMAQTQVLPDPDDGASDDADVDEATERPAYTLHDDHALEDSSPEKASVADDHDAASSDDDDADASEYDDETQESIHIHTSGHEWTQDDSLGTALSAPTNAPVNSPVSALTDTVRPMPPASDDAHLARFDVVDESIDDVRSTLGSAPPDLPALATSALHAGLHVANYVSPHLRKRPPTAPAPQPASSAFVQAVLQQHFTTPERPPAPTEATPSSSARKRLKTSTPSPVPVHEAKKAYPSRSVKLFHKHYHFFLTGFEVPAAKQLQHQIHAYGGKVESKPEAMLDLENKCFVIATPEASRRLKFHYALVCNVPIVHPDWLTACFQTQTIVDIAGYWIPVGLSWTLKRSLVRPPEHNAKLFKELRFGIPYDVSFQDRDSIKGLADAAIFLLDGCGAQGVVRDVKMSAIKAGKVDVLLSNEHTYMCSVATDYDVPVVRFSWVYECIIQQRVVDLAHAYFTPDRFDDDGKLVSKAMEVSLPNEKKMKLCVGEMLLVDTTASAKQHHLRYQVCQVVRIEVADPDEYAINVQLYKRSRGQGQGLVRARKVFSIQPDMIKRKACLLLFDDYARLAYKDPTIFYLEPL
ncbi:hypothetical protein ACHHYP_14862 [Achlya hypogyna]|uniref:BRCT domain-containing protein n=1 Tax=Achlya hypogyna TaxID=1202772 RepID=A0A1V9YC47_ACHHY|nr:hypothetical protein ACHHYP_14862 [Achlya hypogyna]